MPSLTADFDELRERIRHGRELGHASFEPIYYLVFPPQEIIEVKRQTPAWAAKLHQEGWNVHTLSIAEQIWELLKEDPLWSLCVMQDKSAPMDWPRTNKALADILTASNGKPVVTNLAIQGVVGLIMSPDELTTILNNHLSDAQARLHRSITVVTLKDHEIDFTLGGVTI